jgi:hypothetical protein
MMDEKMKKKGFLLYAAFTLLLCHAHAQYSPSFYPFKGFHIGITGQAEFIQPCSFVAISTGLDPVPKAFWTFGWEAGMEFSYHFAKYFGISAGINFGTITAYKYDAYINNIPDGHGGWEKGDPIFIDGFSVSFMSFLFPVKLEFHYPLRKNLFFTADAGVKIFPNVAAYVDDLAKNPKQFFGGSYAYSMYPSNLDAQKSRKITCSLLLGLGLYYKLPYGDLLRFTAGVNVPFNNIVEGNYRYLLTDSYGTFAVKNDFIYTQLSYIHTFKYEKAKRYVKREGLSFASKKERRKKIFALLNGR